MPRALKHPVRPGGLSDADRARIVALAREGRKSGAIARQLEKHPSTVQSYMYGAGLDAPAYRRGPVFRNGRLVKPFDPAEDAFIVSLRVDGNGPKRIAELASAHFGHPRNRHTIRNRLVMLAARDDEEAA